MERLRVHSLVFSSNSKLMGLTLRCATTASQWNQSGIFHTLNLSDVH